MSCQVFDINIIPLEFTNFHTLVSAMDIAIVNTMSTSLMLKCSTVSP